MKIQDDHWLDTARQDPITGGSRMGIRRALVIHFTGGASARSSIQAMRERNVSAHLVIERDGTIWQCRPFDVTCGHAGVSRWVDPKTGIKYSGCNGFTIGIELANAGDLDSVRVKYSPLPPVTARHRNGGPERTWEAYPQAQIDALTKVSKLLVERYNLDDITGHDCIAPERKNDPGPAFPMQALREACGFTGLPAVHHA